MTYVQIVAWHIVTFHLRVPDRVETRCGRQAMTHQVSDTLPLGEKSCETCLRLARHDEETK